MTTSPHPQKPSETRLHRALEQRIYYLGTQHDGSYAIQGSTGEKIYTVAMSDDGSPTCTCPDFANRQFRCKHVYYVLMRLFRVPLNLVHDRAYPRHFIDVWQSDLASRRLALRLQAEEDVIVVSDNEEEEEQVIEISDDDEKEHVRGGGGVSQRPLDGECPICLEDMRTSDDQTFTFCATQCGNNVHLACMARYARHAGRWTCPICRAPWWRGDDDEH